MTPSRDGVEPVSDERLGERESIPIEWVLDLEQTARSVVLQNERHESCVPVELAANEVAKIARCLRELPQARERIAILEALAANMTCTCSTYGQVSLPPQPSDYTVRRWCGRCRALGLDHTGTSHD